MARKLPTLTADLVANRQRLWPLIDNQLQTDPELAATAMAVLAAQEGLRRVVDDDGWNAYLIVEAAPTARLEASALVLVRWAFIEGLNVARRRGGA